MDFSTEDQMCEGQRTEEAKAVAQIEQTRKDEIKTRAQRGVWSLQFIFFFFLSVKIFVLLGCFTENSLKAVFLYLQLHAISENDQCLTLSKLC